MGRVKKYKKIKACDPFAKKTRTNADTVHDEPPDVYNNKVKNSKKRKLYDWENEDQREHLLQIEAKRALKDSDHEKKMENKNKVEPKKPDESLKDFKIRMRKETRKTLVEELQKMTATAKKKKAYLKEKQQKKKNKKKGIITIEQEINEFPSAENGTIRPSDRGDVSSNFPKMEKIGFNETSLRPPDLHSFTKKMNKTKKNVNSDFIQSSEMNEEDEKIDKIDNKKQKISQRNDLDGVDGLEESYGGENWEKGILNSGQNSFKKMANKRESAGNNSSVAEMEQMREKVQEAYKKLREKRHKNNSNFSNFEY